MARPAGVFFAACIALLALLAVVALAAQIEQDVFYIGVNASGVPQPIAIFADGIYENDTNTTFHVIGFVAHVLEPGLYIVNDTCIYIYPRFFYGVAWQWPVTTNTSWVFEVPIYTNVSPTLIQQGFAKPVLLSGSWHGHYAAFAAVPQSLLDNLTFPGEPLQVSTPCGTLNLTWLATITIEVPGYASAWNMSNPATRILNGLLPGTLYLTIPVHTMYLNTGGNATFAVKTGADAYAALSSRVNVSYAIGGNVTYASNTTFAVATQPVINVTCSPPTPEGTMAVRIVVWDWFAAKQVTFTSSYVSGYGVYKILEVNLTTYPPPPQLTYSSPPAAYYWNITTIVVDDTVSVENTWRTLNISAAWVDQAGVLHTKNFVCFVHPKIILEVPARIITYVPRVVINGTVLDYYTHLPIPGLPITIYFEGRPFANVTTDANGNFTLTVVLQAPGTYTLEYFYAGQLIGSTIIDYVGYGGYVPNYSRLFPGGWPSWLFPVSTQPIGWRPSLLLPRPTLNTPTAIVIAFSLLALWVWLARRTTPSYATIVLGLVLSILGVYYWNGYLVAAGAAAMVLGYLMRRSIGV